MMPLGLIRYHHTGQSHFITFSTFHRIPNFAEAHSRDTFEHALERIRRDYQLYVYGYVVMPDHVHLLLSEPKRDTLAVAIKSLKQGVARRLLKSGDHFWQKRYYDHNIRTHSQFVEKLWYLHQNPVTAGLCRSAEEWPWSSFRHFSTGQEGTVEIESEWTARKRERKAGTLAPAIALPTQAN